MRRWLTRGVVCLMALMLFSCSAWGVNLYVDTTRIETDVPPTIVSGRTLVPLRAIFESLDAEVGWEAATQTVTAYKDGTTVVLQIGNPVAQVNGEPCRLDVPAQIVQNRTMVPARFVAETLDCTVTWDGNTATAAVAYELKGQHIYVTKSGKRYHFSSTCNGGTYYEATLAEAMGRGLTPCQKCVLK